MTIQPKPRLLWPQTILFASTLLITLVGVPWYGAVIGYDWQVWLAFALVAGANGMAITAGYHRLWAHNTYKAHGLLKVFFALFGAAALQNSILVWASGHRYHHRHVDDNDKDPYSAGRGLWFSHIGWMLRDYPSGQTDFSNAKDLQRDPIVMWQHRYYLPLAISMNLLPALLYGWLSGNYLAGLLVIGVARLVFSHHTTFFINSLAHFWGKQPYTQANSARDNGVLALFTYGEGYHNFHHLFQNDYRNGVRWWQYDPTKWLIKCASWLGLTWDLQQVPGFRIREAVLHTQFQSAASKLARLPNAEQLSQALEQEYRQFAACLQEWKKLREAWYTQKRSALAETRQDLQRKWERNALRTRFKELEFSLKMQQRRLRYFNLQLAAA